MVLNGIPYDEHSCSRSSSPSIDIYYHQDFRQHQSLTANIVGTYIKTTGDVENNEGSDYRYTTDGQTYTLWSEAIYENRLKPFTVSSGAQFAQRYSHNIYQGDVDATNDMHTSSLYLFLQLKGHLGQFSYMGGLGVSRRYYRQADTKQNFWLFRPKLTVSYPLADRLKLKYDFEITQHTSQIALVSDVSIKQNSMETILGNPDIHPNRMTSHHLLLSYNTPRFTSELQGYYRINSHCNLEKYIRQNCHFYQTQTNADNECSFFYVESYNQWDMIPDKLTATVYGGIYRFFSISLLAQYPFSQHPLANKTEVMGRYVQKGISQHSRDYGNMLTLKLSYRLDHGRKYRDIQRSMNHSYKETGILSK